MAVTGNIVIGKRREEREVTEKKIVVGYSTMSRGIQAKGEQSVRLDLVWFSLV